MRRELARQGFHVLTMGVLIVLAWVLSQPWFLLFCAAALFLGSVLVYVQPRFIQHAILLFDRPDAAFTGKGAFMAVLGAFLTALLFPAYLVPALAVLAVADAVATLVGVRFGRWRTPWSARKSWAGIAAFLVCSAGVLFLLGASWLVPALCATVVEAADYHGFFFLDDNVLVPLTVAAALML